MIRTLTLTLILACSLWACTSTSSEPTPAAGPDTATIEPDEDAVAVERVITPSAEMLAAALTGDPLQMKASAATQGSCPSASTCPAQYGACTSWSAYSECNFTCINSQLCACPFPEHPDDPPCEPNPLATLATTYYSGFRVCFNAQGSACTEFRRTISNYCGC